MNKAKYDVNEKCSSTSMTAENNVIKWTLVGSGEGFQVPFIKEKWMETKHVTAATKHLQKVRKEGNRKKENIVQSFHLSLLEICLVKFMVPYALDQFKSK